MPTDLNPADHATRYHQVPPAAQLQHSSWLSGPAFLYQDKSVETLEPYLFSLIEPEADNEIRPEVSTLATKVSEFMLSSQHFERCSSWQKLCQIIARLIHVAASFKSKTDEARKKATISRSELSQAKVLIIRSVQHKAFKEEFKCIED